ncbi:hypothetical protein OQX63_23055 [Pedobacter sp. PF22-3]|uniref:hypothetical protein n=1 Tax=Pedobacter sp. PF22-3 TaxID=2994467 RepID=UPI00224702C6|nr:hypothetical protein [Pedobacter sp. PF22-3]MCX2496388.1 hypothetical protein [Pedobacter sp. PF22-3]
MNKYFTATFGNSLLAKRFGNGSKITLLTKLHSRTYGAIKARLIKVRMIHK